ncbi:condensation domain-containing protein [Kitasatospora sp. NPDC018619]|uniref:condensation domain-containing protein n=1 Tax=unclassified Kitasatospora TaxID=2633591 RepID=UPI0037BC93D6
MAAAQPLSVGQEALWFLYRLAPDSAAYSILSAVRVRTPLDDALLDRAVRAVAGRHAVLRSRYREVDGRPHRADLGADAVRLEVREVGPVSDERLYALVREVYEAPFRLSSEPPLRVALLRLGPADAVLVLVVHHIAGDATSQWLVLRELLDAHQSAALTGETGLAPLPLGYEDHVAAERALIASPRGARMAAYWRAVRAGATAAELPTDRPRPPVQSFRGSACAVPLPDGAGARVRAAAEELGVTPFAFLLGVFQVLVHRYAGYGEALIGCAASNRTPRTLGLVGYLVNPLPLRSSIHRSTTFRQAVLAAQSQVLHGMANVGYPTVLAGRGEGAQEAPEAKGPPAHLAFTLIAADRLEPRLPYPAAGRTEGPEYEYRGLRLAVLDLPHMEGQFDLNADVRLTGDALTAFFRYDTALFERGTVERIAAGYARLLAAALADVDAPVARASLADQDELLRMLAMGAGTPA